MLLCQPTGLFLHATFTLSLVEVIGKTGIFDWIGDAFLRATGGRGQRFLLLIVALAC